MKKIFKSTILTFAFITTILIGFFSFTISGNNLNNNTQIEYNTTSTRATDEDQIIYDLSTSINFYDVTATSATFMVTLDEEWLGIGEEGVDEDDMSTWKVNPAEDLILISDYEVGKDTYSTKTNISGIKTETDKDAPSANVSTTTVELSYLGEFGADDPNKGNFPAFEYQLNNLVSDREYSNFGIAFKSSGTTWSDLISNDEILLTDERIVIDFPLEDVTFVTSHDIVFYVWVSIILLTLLILLILFLILVRAVIWWHRHMSLSLYFDGLNSLSEGELIINLLHVKRYKHLWNAHEEDLLLIAAGRPVEAVFKKSESIPGGYRIYVTDDTSQKRTVLSIMSASKYDQYHIGIKGQHDTNHAYVLSDKKAKKITRMISRTVDELNEETREHLLENVLKKTGKDVVKAKKDHHNVIAHISDVKSTPTSLRYQVLYSDTDAMLTDHDPIKDDNQIKFYYVYNGKLYEMEHKFVNKIGHMFEYDLINLQPGTIYTGLSKSLDGGKTIFPSAALYGTTKDNQGHILSKTHAALAKPAKRAKGVQLWSFESALNQLGEVILHRTFDVLTKKHYEDENPDNFLSIEKAYEYYDDYILDWLEDSVGAHPETSKIHLITAPEGHVHHEQSNASKEKTTKDSTKSTSTTKSTTSKTSTSKPKTTKTSTSKSTTSKTSTAKSGTKSTTTTKKTTKK